jgi:hypothetical protein
MMMLGLRMLLAFWICTFTGATNTTLCGTLAPFVSEMNTFLESAIGATADCTDAGPLSATVSFEGDIEILGYDFGNFGMYFTINPCDSVPSIDFGATVAGTDEQLTSVVYGQAVDVPIPDMNIGVASLDLSVTLSGTMSNSILQFGLAVMVFGHTVGTIELTGSDGIEFSLSDFECPACPYLLGAATPEFIDGLSCPAIYGLFGGGFLLLAVVLGISCCACCKTCCFRRPHAVAKPVGLRHLLVTEDHQQGDQAERKAQYEQQNGLQTQMMLPVV